MYCMYYKYMYMYIHYVQTYAATTFEKISNYEPLPPPVVVCMQEDVVKVFNSNHTYEGYTPSTPYDMYDTG